MPVSDARVIRAIRAAELFAGLTDEELAALDAVGQPMSFLAGDRIFSLGESARSILLVESGHAALTLPLDICGTTKEVTVEEKSPGATIAWSALVPPHKYTLSAQAATDLTLVGLARESIETVFMRHPRIHLAVTSNLCRVIGGRVSMLEALLIRDLQRWVDDKVKQAS